MDAPYYTVTVSSVTEYGAGGSETFPVPAAWSYSYTHGEEPDLEDDVHLGAPFTYVWGFEDGLIPGQLLPSVASVTLWCRTLADVPDVGEGDLLALEVRAGDASGPVILSPPAMRVVDIAAILTPDPEGETWAVKVTIGVVDVLTELRGVTIEAPLGMPAATYNSVNYGARTNARSYWQPRLAELGALIGRSIGCPTTWTNTATGEHPSAPTGGVAYGGLELVDIQTGQWSGKSAYELITRLLNSHQPGGITHTITPRVASSYPAGYRYVGPPGPNWEPGGYEQPIADPASLVRFIAVPASRVDGEHGAHTLDAAWCEVPALGRRTRGHIINRVALEGTALVANPSDPNLVYRHTPATVEYNAGERRRYGTSARAVPTALYLYRHPFDIPATATDVVGPRFLSDASVRAADYTYDKFTLFASAIPQATAEALLPVLSPRTPGETDGDGHVVRHLTITNLHNSIGDTVSGFATSGVLTIDKADLAIELTLTPGDPT